MQVGDLTIFKDTVMNEVWLGQIYERTQNGNGYMYSVLQLVPERSPGVFMDYDDTLQPFSNRRLKKMSPGNWKTMRRAFHEAIINI